MNKEVHDSRILNFNSIGDLYFDNTTKYLNLTLEHGLFGDAIRRKCGFSCIAEAEDITNPYLKFKVGWSAITNYRSAYSAKTFPLYGTYVLEQYRQQGISSCLTLLTFDMAEECNVPFVVIDAAIRDRMKSLCEGSKVKILPIWFNFYPKLLFASSILTEEELSFYESPKALKNLGVDVATEIASSELNDVLESESQIDRYVLESESQIDRY